MEEISKNIRGDEVISINDKKDGILISHSTYTIKEFLDKLSANICYSSKKWLNDGVPCKMLAPNQKWQNGKIKICVQFIPDQPESILDDIRQDK